MSDTDELGRPTVSFDLVDASVAKDPGPYFDRLRSQCPVAHTSAYDGFWLLARYDDVHEAARNTAVFSSASGVIIPAPPTPPFMCLEQDEPGHSAFRQPMQSWFSPGRVSALEDRVRTIVTGLIDQFVADGTADLATALAEPVPPIVIAMVLGLPDADWPWFREKSQGYLKATAAGDLEAAVADVTLIVGYLGEQLEERRRHPRDDMLTDVTRIRIDGAALAPDEAVSLTFLILAAGHETTVGALGGMLYHVARRADVRDRLLADRTLVEPAVEEALRLEPPLPGLGRTVLSDVTVRGVTMAAGDRVMLLWGSANRDADVFGDPESFRLDRASNRHLAFGSGIHRCVGAPLARLEMRVVLEEVLRRMPRLTLASDAATTVGYATTSRSYRTLPAIW